jgi:transcriptional regulator with XRE-family HTH domain
MGETFGARLRRIRSAQGVTVVDLALKVGAAEGTVRQIENGSVKMPNMALGVRMADALNVDPRYLAFGEGESTSERFDMIERRLTQLERVVAEQPKGR